MSLDWKAVYAANWPYAPRAEEAEEWESQLISKHGESLVIDALRAIAETGTTTAPKLPTVRQWIKDRKARAASSSAFPRPDKCAFCDGTGYFRGVDVLWGNKGRNIMAVCAAGPSCNPTECQHPYRATHLDDCYCAPLAVPCCCSAGDRALNTLVAKSCGAVSEQALRQLQSLLKEAVRAKMESEQAAAETGFETTGFEDQLTAAVTAITGRVE